MVSTRSRTANVPLVVPTVEVGDPGPASEISHILEAQARMQQEFAEYKKRNADEMEALREENSRLRQKIEADQAAGEPYQPRSRADIPRASASATPSTLSLSLRCTHCHHTLRPPPSASATTSRASALHFASLSVALSLASSLSPLHPLPPHSPATVDLLRPLATTFGQCNHHASEPPPFCISLCRSLSLSGHRRPPATTSRFFSSNCSTAIPPRYVSNSFLFHFPFCIYYF